MMRTNQRRISRFAFALLVLVHAAWADGADAPAKPAPVDDGAYVAIVEHDFYRSTAEFAGATPSAEPACRSFQEYVDGGYDKFADHAHRVSEAFARQAHGLRVLPLTLDSGSRRAGSALLLRTFEVFDCLEKLAAGGKLRGVNFSVSVSESERKNLAAERAELFDRIGTALGDRIRKFLGDHPDVVITLATGDAAARLENLVAFPLTSVCSATAPPNLYCVTSFRHDPEFPFIRTGETSRSFPIGRFRHVYTGAPCGTEASPLPITARFAESANFLAVGARHSQTSFLAPLALALILDGRAKIESGYGVTLTRDERGLGVYPVKYLIAPAN